MRKKGGFSSPRQQSGYILIVSVILLGAMLIATLQYFEQSKNSIQTSGYNRNASEALLLAESAANMLYGQYVFGDDIDGDNIEDHREGFDESKLNELPLFYMYYRSDNKDDEVSDTLDKTQPGILQLIANGEARTGTSRTSVTTGKHKIPGDASNLIITELFSNVDNVKVKPVIYILNDNTGLLNIYTGNNTWTGISNSKKAAAWLELVKDADNNTVRVYAQAAAQIGNSKNYVQRFVGVFSNNLGLIAATTESK